MKRNTEQRVSAERSEAILALRADTAPSCEYYEIGAGWHCARGCEKHGR